MPHRSIACSEKDKKNSFLATRKIKESEAGLHNNKSLHLAECPKTQEWIAFYEKSDDVDGHNGEVVPRQRQQ